MAPPTLQSRFTIPDSAVFRELDGEAVLLNLETGQYFGLNAVGTRIWQLLIEHGRTQAVLDALLTEFDAEPAVLQSDLLGLLEQLAAHGLVAAAP
jgi:hypothetical protein